MPGVSSPAPTMPATLTELLARRVREEPDTPYFHLYDETVTYGRLWRESARYAAGLKKAGVGPTDKVCLIYPTCAEFFYTFFGALRLGAVPVPLFRCRSTPPSASKPPPLSSATRRRGRCARSAGSEKTWTNRVSPPPTCAMCSSRTTWRWTTQRRPCRRRGRRTRPSSSTPRGAPAIRAASS